MSDLIAEGRVTREPASPQEMASVIDALEKGELSAMPLKTMQGIAARLEISMDLVPESIDLYET